MTVDETWVDEVDETGVDELGCYTVQIASVSCTGRSVGLCVHIACIRSHKEIVR